MFIISKRVTEHCKMALFRLIKTYSAPRRKFPPTIFEINLSVLYRKIPLPICIYHKNV